MPESGAGLLVVGYYLTSAQWSALDTAQANDCNSCLPSHSAAAVTTDAASGVTNTAATFNGTVNSEGTATIYRFQHGTSAS